MNPNQRFINAGALKAPIYWMVKNNSIPYASSGHIVFLR